VRKIRGLVRASYLEVLVTTAVGQVTDFADEYPEQPEPTGEYGEQEVEDKVPKAILFHYVSFVIRGFSL
jgi:hypothetical protein